MTRRSSEAAYCDLQVQPESRNTPLLSLLQIHLWVPFGTTRCEFVANFITLRTSIAEGGQSGSKQYLIISLDRKSVV